MRTVFGIVLFFLIVISPYWVYLPAIALGVVFFPFYIEAIFFGLFIDTIYGRVGDNMLFGYTFGILGALAVIAGGPIRSRLRFNT